jgi:antitoxin component YwqK of YwqJK toxin-antitoxin module
MRITDYIENFWFENIADKLNPDYKSMLYQFDDKTDRLRCVTFKSTIDNKWYRVVYTYNTNGNIAYEVLLDLSKIIRSARDITTGAIITYHYKYTYEYGCLFNITVTSYNQFIVVKNKGLVKIKSSCAGNTRTFMKKYMEDGRLISTIEIDIPTRCRIFRKYDVNGNIIKEYCM